MTHDEYVSETEEALRLLADACQRAQPYRAWFYLEWSLPRLMASGDAWVVRVEKRPGDAATQHHGLTAPEALNGARRMLENAE